MPSKKKKFSRFQTGIKRIRFSRTKISKSLEVLSEGDKRIRTFVRKIAITSSPLHIVINRTPEFFQQKSKAKHFELYSMTGKNSMTDNALKLT